MSCPVTTLCISNCARSPRDQRFEQLPLRGDMVTHLGHAARFDLEEDRDAKLVLRGQELQLDVGDRAHFHPLELDRGADVQPFRALEVGHEARFSVRNLAPPNSSTPMTTRATAPMTNAPISFGSPDSLRCSFVDGQRPSRCLRPSAVAFPAGEKRPHLRIGAGLAQLLGIPLAIMVLVSASRKTELFPMAKMLASSCVTTTTVAPRLSRSSRINSSSSAS